MARKKLWMENETGDDGYMVVKNSSTEKGSFIQSLECVDRNRFVTTGRCM